jgi:hypothetical protein
VWLLVFLLLVTDFVDMLQSLFSSLEMDAHSYYAGGTFDCGDERRPGFWSHSAPPFNHVVLALFYNKWNHVPNGRSVFGMKKFDVVFSLRTKRSCTVGLLLLQGFVIAFTLYYLNRHDGRGFVREVCYTVSKEHVKKMYAVYLSY